MRAVAKILRAQASEHSSNFCEQFEQRPNFASTFKFNETIGYPSHCFAHIGIDLLHLVGPACGPLLTRLYKNQSREIFYLLPGPQTIPNNPKLIPVPHLRYWDHLRTRTVHWLNEVRRPSP